MSIYIKWSIAVLFVVELLAPGIAFSDPVNFSQGDRYKIMDREMACIKKQIQQNITWDDICSIADSQNTPISSHGSQDAVLAHWNGYTNLNDTIAIDSDLFKEYQFQISSEFSNISYKQPGMSVKENGPFFGIDGAYDWRPDNIRTWAINVLHFDSHFNFGLVDYKSPDSQASHLDDYLLEPRLWLGRDFSPIDFTRLTPYIGLGYRFLFDHLGQATDIGGYDRSSEYLYIPIGFEIKNQSIPGWQFGINMEYDIFIQGWQESYLSDVNNAYPNINSNQNRGYGLRFSVDIIKKMGHINMLFSPYIRYWNVHQSKITTAINPSSGIGFPGYEPSNNSTELGAKMGVQF